MYGQLIHDFLTSLGSILKPVAELLLANFFFETFFPSGEAAGRRRVVSTYSQSGKIIPSTRCLKITEKVSFNIASEASYVYILSGQK